MFGFRGWKLNDIEQTIDQSFKILEYQLLCIWITVWWYNCILNFLKRLNNGLRVAFHLICLTHVYEVLALLYQEALLAGIDMDHLLWLELIKANYLWRLALIWLVWHSLILLNLGLCHLFRASAWSTLPSVSTAASIGRVWSSRAWSLWCFLVCWLGLWDLPSFKIWILVLFNVASLLLLLWNLLLLDLSLSLLLIGDELPRQRLIMNIEYLSENCVLGVVQFFGDCFESGVHFFVSQRLNCSNNWVCN